MIEYICLALLVFIGFQDYQNRKERKRLIDAFLAKNLKELKEPERRAEPTMETMPLPDIPLDEADDELFDKSIKKELGRETVVEKAVDKLKGVVKRG